jgi:UDP-N-acetylglucosamine diphosphorylase / glucose-1-phosphate thymidylyltransferase / UDP-N-acetylgalactosamine diphosphorylase / glucosamine-1-phosphate N-acetyltransferase / galactosamine-1-phosphate N-acetyltransferase
MKAVILAAGKGTNLSPITTTRPLPMIGLAGSTLFDNTLDLLKKSGINDVFVVVGHQKEKLIERINDNDRNGLNLHYIIQSKNEAIGRAVLQAKSKISPGEYFLLIYGDTITSENLFAKAQQSFHTFKCPIASICLPPSNEMFGNVFLNAQMKITQIIEKPKGDNLGNYVLSGAFVLPESFFSLLEKNGRNMEKALKSLVAEGNLMASMWEDGWLDIVYPWHILEANKMLMDSWNESSIAKSAVLEANVTIQGVAHIAEGAVIKAGAVLEGPCSIGKGSYIGNNSLIRSYTSLGANCSVGYGVELKNCVILDRTRVGRLSFIGDSVLGENVDFGAGSMTVNRNLDWTPITVKIGNQNVSSGLTKLGAFVGDNVVVGAGNMIKPGTSVAPGKILPACYSVTD